MFWRCGESKESPLADTILQCKVERKISRERPTRWWMDNAKEWTRLRSNEIITETPRDRVAWGSMSVVLPQRTELSMGVEI